MLMIQESGYIKKKIKIIKNMIVCVLTDPQKRIMLAKPNFQQ
jgi:hypothetical protein